MSIHQRNAYQLAETLGMTVTRMMSEMTMAEYFGWMAFYGERELEAEGKLPQTFDKDGGVIMRGFDLS